MAIYEVFSDFSFKGVLGRGYQPRGLVRPVVRNVCLEELAGRTGRRSGLETVDRLDRWACERPRGVGITHLLAESPHPQHFRCPDLTNQRLSPKTDDSTAHSPATEPELVADQIGGFVVPPVWCGFSTLANDGFPYTLEFGRDIVVLLLQEYLDQLAMVGLKLGVVLTGHYGPKHVAALVEAANTFAVFGHHSETVVWVPPEYELARELGYHGDHAARWETSLLMRLRPELVDIGRLDDRAAAEGIGGEDLRGSTGNELEAQVVERIVENLSLRVAHFPGF